MATLTLKNVGKQYPNGFEAVKDVSVDIEDKEVVVFMGPSGCGKSTLLRVLAGMESITSGEFSIDGKVINDVEAKDREIALLFENYAIYQSMSVYDNLAFGLKLRGLPKDEIYSRVMDTARIVDLIHLLDRKPKALSDVQQHRLAMGRAIICQPKAIIMNEPFMYIERKYRKAMWAELANLQQRLGITIAYVTNDQDEAMRLANRIVIMHKGKVQQIGTAKELFENPCNLMVADYFGKPQIRFRDAVCREEDGKVFLDTGIYRVPLPEGKGEKLIKGCYSGKTVIMGIRLEDDYEEIEKIDGEKVHIFDKETEVTISN